MHIPNRFTSLLAIVISLSAAMQVAWSASPADSRPERIAADTPRTTVLGNTFVAPAGWTMTVRGAATILEAPEGGSFLVLVDIPVKDAASDDDAVKAAWAAYKPDARWPLKVTNPIADRDGWTHRKGYDYQTSPNEKRGVGADVRRANDVWTVTLYDMAAAVGEKRSSQVGLALGKLLPKGYKRESFAGKKAHPLDQARIAELSRFVESAMQASKIPGVSLALYQGGKTVFAGGFGARELGKATKVDANTKYMVASNTKAMATLMLAKLVDAKKLAWDTPAMQALPSFKLGNEQTTRQVQIKHLICACT